MGQAFFEQLRQPLGRLKSLLRILRVQPRDDAGEPVWNGRVQFTQRPRLLVGHSPQHAVTCLRAKRWPAGTEHVHHAAQTEQIAPRVDRLTACLFGRHELRRAGDDSRSREARVVRRASETEVREQNSIDSPFQQNVCRFDVSMNQPLRMSGREPARHLMSNPQNVERLQRSLTIDALLQRLTRHVRHDKVRQPAARIHCQDRHDVGMNDHRGRLRFSCEPLSRGAAAGQVRREHLHDDRPVELFLKPLEDNSHAASTDDLKNVDPVKPAECFFRQGRREEVDGEIGERVFVSHVGRPVAIVRRSVRSRVAQYRPDASPLKLLRSELFELFLARDTAREVLNQPLLIAFGESVLKRSDQQVAAAGQGWRLLGHSVSSCCFT